jgi:hypothetical protein
LQKPDWLNRVGCNQIHNSINMHTGEMRCYSVAM